MTEAEMTKMADYFAVETKTVLERAIDLLDERGLDVLCQRPKQFTTAGYWCIPNGVDAGDENEDFDGKEGESLRSVLERWYLKD